MLASPEFEPLGGDLHALSGKGLDGLLDLTREGHFDGMSNVVFLHTGGSAALFGYPDTFNLPGYITN